MGYRKNIRIHQGKTQINAKIRAKHTYVLERYERLYRILVRVHWEAYDTWQAESTYYYRKILAALQRGDSYSDTKTLSWSLTFYLLDKKNLSKHEHNNTKHPVLTTQHERCVAPTPERQPLQKSKFKKQRTGVTLKP